jgi:hypothetical protein
MAGRAASTVVRVVKLDSTADADTRRNEGENGGDVSVGESRCLAVVPIFAIPRQLSRRSQSASGSIIVGSILVREQLRLQMQETRPARRRAVVPLQKILEFAGDSTFATDALRFQRHNTRRNACALQWPHQRNAVADAENGRIGHYQGSDGEDVQRSHPDVW